MNNLIKISGIITESIVDGPGIRYVVFFQGCHHNCPGCQNIHSHNCDGGYFKNIDEIIDEINYNKLITGVTISGGEPFLQPDKLFILLTKIKCIFKFSIIVYTGYIFEDLLKINSYYIKKSLNIIDFIIDGRFEVDKKTFLFPFIGSWNQRIINVKNTFKSGVISLEILNK